MAVKIIDNTKEINQFFKQKGSIFLRSMADEMQKEAKPNTPKDKGNLRRDILKQVLGLKGKVVWRQNYGVYQETKQYKNYTTPGTGPRFAENAAKSLPKKTNTIAKRVGLI